MWVFSCFRHCLFLQAPGWHVPAVTENLWMPSVSWSNQLNAVCCEFKIALTPHGPGKKLAVLRVGT